MDTQTILKAPETPISSKQFEEIYGSRNFLYDLIKKGVVKPHYLGCKPFFFISEINAAMSAHPSIK